MCHTNTVRVSRIRKRVAACGERMDPDGGSTGTRRTGEVVWVRNPSASDPGLGRELTEDSARRESAVRAGGSFQDALNVNDPGFLCQLVPEHSEPEPGGGASMAAPPRRKPAAGARAARGDADGGHPAIRDSPELASPTVDLFDWSDVIERIAAEEVEIGNVDETRIPDSVAGASPAPRRGDSRFGGSTPPLDAAAGTPSPPFGARAPAFPGVPVYGPGGDGAGLDHAHHGRGGVPGSPERGDGDGGFRLEYVRSILGDFSDREESPRHG